jgi:flagellar motor switch protein FliM
LATALGPQKLQVQAQLTPVTVTLGDLSSLVVGDILILPHMLDTPLQVTDPQQGPLCDAWLGQRDGRVALELVGIASETRKILDEIPGKNP